MALQLESKDNAIALERRVTDRLSIARTVTRQCAVVTGDLEPWRCWIGCDYVFPTEAVAGSDRATPLEQ
jgi:hypothetical protein